MENVHDLNDRAQEFNVRNDESAFKDVPNWETLSFKTKEPVLDPLNEGFFYMLRLNFCPLLTWLSFIVFLSITLVIIFFVQLRVDGFQPKPKEFLEVKDKGKFSNWGTTNLQMIKEKNQYYRVLASLFLHSGGAHLISNLIMIIIWGSFLEGLMKPLRTCFIFLLAGIFGNLASALASRGKYDSLGASTGVFGFFGAGIGYLMVNWIRMKHRRSPRGMFLCVLIIVILLNFIFVPENAALVSHFGGFIGGLLVSLFLSPLYINPYKKDDPEHTKRGVCGIFWLIFGIIGYFGLLALIIGFIN